MVFSPHKKMLLGVAVLAVIVSVAAGAWQYEHRSSVPGFPINSADRISSWSFTGAYTDDVVLVPQAKKDIARLQALLAARVCTEAEATSTMESDSTACNPYDKYDLYIGMGNDYNLLGDGRAAYREYNRAVAIHLNKGLAYMNLGHLFDELGAYQTAADAYAKATTVEAGQITYHIERLKFLTTRFPEDKERVLAALTDASNQFGDAPAVLSIEAQWLEGQGKYAQAIQAWETVKMLSPADRQSAIDAQITRDRAKE